MHELSRLRAAFRFIRAGVSAVLVIAVVMATSVGSLEAQEAESPAATPETNEESSKQKKKEKKGKTVQGGRILPIPIFITEPAIGVGFGAALAYFHKKKGDADDEAKIPRAMNTQSAGETGKKKKPPPTISGVAGGYTDNGTWAAGVGHSTSWKMDTIRYSGFVAYADIKSTIYRLDIPFNFDIKGGMLYQDIRFRLGGTNFFLGGKLSALAATSKIELGTDRPVELGEGDTTNVGLAAQAIWETRDNVMTPNQGQLIQFDAWRYDDALGGDFDYWHLNLKVNSFHQLHDRFVLGWRLEGDAVDGRPPFWGYPWVSLRGVPALRFQNQRIVVGEIEGRFSLAKRWGVVGFAGRGGAYGDIPVFDTEKEIYAGGIGGRFLFLEDENLWVGIDVARGPEDTYWYIQVGQAW